MVRNCVTHHICGCRREQLDAAESRAATLEADLRAAVAAYRELVTAIEDLDMNLASYTDHAGEWVTMYQMGTGRWHHILGLVRGNAVLARPTVAALREESPSD